MHKHFKLAEFMSNEKTLMCNYPKKPDKNMFPILRDTLY